MGLTCLCPAVWLLTAGSASKSDPKSYPRNNLFHPRSVHLCSIAGRVKTAQGGIGKIDRPLRQTNPGLAKIQASPASQHTRPRPAARESKKTLTKGPPKMIARTTRQISQANSHHSTRDRTATSRAVCSTSQPSPAENPSRQLVKLIHGSAIKISGKRPRISKLQNSNRR